MADRKKFTAAELERINTANELFQKQLEIEKNLVAQEQKLNDARGRRASAIQKEMELLDAQISLAEENLKVAKMSDEAMQARINLLDDSKNKTISQQEELEKLTKQLKLFGDGGREAFIKLNEELLATAERMAKVRLAGVSINQQFMAMFGVTNKWRDGVVGAFADASEAGGSFGEVLEQVGREFKSTENQMNILGSTLEKSQEAMLLVVKATKDMAFSVDAAKSSVLLATGGFNNYDQVLNEIRASHLDLAVTAEDVAEAFIRLDSTVRSYSLMTDTTQKQIAEFAVTMEKMGVSTDASAEAMQVSIAVLGQTKDQALITQRELLGVAKSLKEAPETMVKGFADSAPQLAKHGNDMLGVFKRLSAAAKALQTDVSTLTGAFGTQMDTFEGAATAGAQLNALLGGQYLDTVAILHADEEERVRMVLGAIETSGQQAALLENKFGRLAFASAAGITDVSDANKLLQMGLGGYDTMIAKANASAMSQEEMRKRAEKAVDIQKKLVATMQSLAIAMEPVVDFTKSMLDGFIELNTSMKGGLIPTISFLVAGLTLYLMKLKIQAARQMAAVLTGKTELALTGKISVAKKAEASARNKNAAAMQREATAAKNQAASGVTSVAGTAGMMAKAKAAMAYGAALAFVGVGFLAVAHGVATLANAVKGMDLAEFMMTLGLAAGIGVGLFFFAKGILAVGAAGTLGAPGILAIGGAVALIGVGLAIPIAAMALLVDKLKEAGPAAIESGQAFLLLSGGVTMLAAGMALMATFGTPGAMGLIVFAGGLTAVALALKLMGDELTSLGKMFEGLGKFAEAGGANFTGMVQGVKDLASAAKGISVDQLTGYSALATVTHQIAGSVAAFEKPEAKVGATRIKETIRTAPGVKPAASGPTVVNLSKESAKTLASEIVNSMKDSSSDWKFFLGLGDSSASDYMRMHTRMAQKTRGHGAK